MDKPPLVRGFSHSDPQFLSGIFWPRHQKPTSHEVRQEAGGPGTWIAVAPSDPAALVAGRRFGRVILERRGAILWDLVKVLNSRSDSHAF